MNAWPPQLAFGNIQLKSDATKGRLKCLDDGGQAIREPHERPVVEVPALPAELGVSRGACGF